jgi:hypothetical protein
LSAVISPPLSRPRNKSLQRIQLITENVGSSIAEPRRCCALLDRTFSKMLVLASTTHHRVILSTAHHRPQHCTVLHCIVPTCPTYAQWHLRFPLLSTSSSVGCSRLDRLLLPKWPRKPIAVSARFKGCGKRCAATPVPRLPRLGWVGVGPWRRTCSMLFAKRFLQNRDCIRTRWHDSYSASSVSRYRRQV